MEIKKTVLKLAVCSIFLTLFNPTAIYSYDFTSKDKQRPCIEQTSVNIQKNKHTWNAQKRQIVRDRLSGNNAGEITIAQGVAGTSVLLPKGNFYSVDTDLPSTRFDSVLLFARYYNSVNAERDSAFGYGWSHRFDVQVTEFRRGIEVKWADGSTHFYKRKGKRYIKPKGIYNDLVVKDNGSLYIITPDKRTYAFDSPQNRQLATISDLNGICYTVSHNMVSGKAVKVTDRWGDWVAFTYNRAGKISEVNDSIGRKVIYHYDSEGRMLSKVRGVMGDPVTYSYDQRKNLIEKKYSDGVTVKMKYDKKHRVIEQGNQNTQSVYAFRYSDEEKKIEYYEGEQKKSLIFYNNDNKIVREIDAKKKYSENAYNKKGNLVRHKDENGNVYRYRYDEKGNIIEVIDPLKYRMQYGYSKKNDRCQWHINKNSYKTKFRYDSRDNLIETIDAQGAKTVMLNNRHGLPTNITNPLGTVTLCTYNKRGNIREIVKYFGSSLKEKDTVVSQYKNDALGNVTEYIDPKGNKTIYNYNLKGKLVEIQKIVPAGKKTLIKKTYDQFDNVVSIEDVSGNITKYSYTKDWWRNVSEVENALGAKTCYMYNSYGNVIKRIDALGGETLYTYDVLSRIIQVQFPGANTKKYAYDAVGNLVSVTDGNDNKTRYLYDKDNRITAVIGAANIGTRYIYDPAGNIAKVIDAKGRENVFVYDKVGRQLFTLNEFGVKTQFVYDMMGNVVSKRDGNNNETKYAYDPLGRVIKISYDNQSPVVYVYDKNNNVISIGNGKKKKDIKISYDEMNRKKTVVTTRTKLEYAYDLVGNVQQMKVGTLHDVTYAYDALNRIQKITTGAHACAFTYDLLNRLISRSFPNGITTAYQYDKNGNIISIKASNHEKKKLLENVYTYDNAGNKKSMTTASGTVIYAYDKNDQIIEASYSDGEKERYAYDVNRNRIKSVLTGNVDTGTVKAHMGYDYNEANQLVSLTSRIGFSGEPNKTVYEYDDSGNLIKETSPDGEIIYTYTTDNKLEKVSKFNKIKAEFEYDLLGRRIAKIEGDGRVCYTYNGLEKAVEYGKEGEIKAFYITGFCLDIPLVTLLQNTGVMHTYFQDALGSVTAVFNKDAAIIKRYTYTPFGYSTLQPKRFGFTAREYDRSTGLYYYRARYYNPLLGRFIQPDPLGMPDGTNRYIYCLNKNSKDRTFLCDCFRNQ
ncbi:MAG: RHS repeat-associated core domain-containing protein [Candidatus Ancaeobacter aquaticus]|nr:RHS repeat-associated core domain-containing protein [Candidatus Ancaeobacter aquaticus]